MEKTIHILLVDDHPMFREGLARTIEKEPDLKVVGQCGSSAEAMKMIHRDVHVIVLDVDLGAERAMEFVTAAKKAAFEGRILIVTAGISGQEAVRLIQAGVAGILDKRQSGQSLCESIRKVAAGEGRLDERYVTSLIQSVDQTRARSEPKLSERDRALLRHLLAGLTNREIGVHLHLSEGGVKASLRQLFDKLNVRSRGQLVKVALEQYRDELHE